MNPIFSLEGKLAIVTGARRGLGFAIARSLAEAGADIVAVSAQIEETGSDIQEEVEKLGRRFQAVQCDFSDASTVDKVGKDLSVLGAEILVNNAGTIYRSPAIEHSIDSWTEIMNVNLNNQFRFTQHIAKEMLKRKKGKIVFTASLLSFQGGINVPSYTASKSGILGLVRALSNEWSPHGVNVNAIVPGYFSTDNTAALRDDPKRSQSILERIPQGRWGNPDDLAGAAVFLTSGASDYVTGISLPVDGGWLAR